MAPSVISDQDNCLTTNDAVQSKEIKRSRLVCSSWRLTSQRYLKMASREHSNGRVLDPTILEPLHDNKAKTDLLFQLEDFKT